jgi:hypothetical protein
MMHMTITLRMMSNSRKSSLVINAHLPIDQLGGSYCSDHRKFEKMAAIIQYVISRFIQGVTYLLKNESYMYSTARSE